MDLANIDTMNHLASKLHEHPNLFLYTARILAHVILSVYDYQDRAHLREHDINLIKAYARGSINEIAIATLRSCGLEITKEVEFIRTLSVMVPAPSRSTIGEQAKAVHDPVFSVSPLRNAHGRELVVSPLFNYQLFSFDVQSAIASFQQCYDDEGHERSQEKATCITFRILQQCAENAIAIIEKLTPNNDSEIPVLAHVAIEQIDNIPLSQFDMTAVLAGTYPWSNPLPLHWRDT